MNQSLIYSAPGRTEISGNHTDHQHGCVLAAAVNLETVAEVLPLEQEIILVVSEGYPSFHVELNDLEVHPEEKNTTTALVRGVAAAFAHRGVTLHGFEVKAHSSVLPGSGLSSSAAFASSEKHSNTSRATAIREIYVTNGQTVKKGDKLMMLDNGEVLKAGLDGVVTEMRFDTSDWLWNNVDLIQISDLTNLKVSLSVDEYDVRNVAAGQTCYVTIVPTGEVFETVISHVDRVSSSSGQVAYYTANAELTVPDSVLPGMPASVTIPSDRADDVLLLDMGALAFDMRIEGNVEELLASDGSVIYICTERIIVMDGGNAKLVGKTLLPDPDIFGADYVVRVAVENENVARDESLFVWVERKGQQEEITVTLKVETDGYAEDAWSSLAPMFLLNTTPALDDLDRGYKIAVSVNDGAPIILSDSIYTAVEEGAYTLRFMILAPDGSVAAKSDLYCVRLDFTAPLLQIRTSNGSMQITAGDSLSGASAVSLDGGATWQPLAAGVGGVATYSYTAAKTEEFAVGKILVRDEASCTTFYPDKVTIRKMSMSSNRGGNKRTQSHSTSTEENITAYNGVELILESGSMTQLTFGDETLELSLLWTGEVPLPEGAVLSFTAQFADLSADGVQDTLMLTAVGVTEENIKDFTWQFTGLVCKKLAASGIEYLMLRTGEQLTVLTTAGFTAGLRYNMYHADGMVSKDFLYGVTMDPETGLQMTVTVEENTHIMSELPTAELYYYDLFYGDRVSFDELVAQYRGGVVQ